MNRIAKALLVVALFGGGLGMGSYLTSNADGLVDPNAPGTANDPIVTKSYVDEAIRSLTGQAPTTGKPPAGGSSPVATSSALVIVELKAGEILAAGEGTEFIVRNGKSVAFSNTVDGISDLTDGVDLKPSVVVPTNHLLLFPREGRGIQPHKDQNGSIFVLVRGTYSHMDSSGKVLNP